MWIPKPKEIDVITRQTSEVRYEYFIKKIVGQEMLWSLRDNEGWCLAADEKNNIFIPEDYAKLCAVDEWSQFTAKDIGLETWLTAWIPGMIRDNRSVVFFQHRMKRELRLLYHSLKLISGENY